MNLYERLWNYYKLMGFKNSVYKILYKLRDKPYAANKPQVLHIELNNTCNLNCQMCPREHLTRKPENMDYDLYKKVILDAAKLGIPHIRLFLFGEPLLYPKIIEAIQFAKKSGIKYVDFNTNANLLNQEMANKLIKSGLDEITFSVDGFSMETYESIRIKGNYNKCVENIINFLNLLKENDVKMATCMQTINFDSIKHETEEYQNFWKDKVDKVIITDLNPIHGLIKEVNYTGYKRIICRDSFYKMVILSNGVVTTCCEDFNGDLAMGDIKINNIKQIWNGTKWVKIRKNFTKLDYSKYEICEKCILSYDTNFCTYIHTREND